MPVLELIDDEYIGVRFQYDRGVVSQLRQLSARRWNPEHKRWEVHIAHFPDLLRIFHLRPEQAPAEILRRYQAQWVKTRVALRVSASFTQIEGGQIPLEAIDQATSFPVHGREYNLMYLDGKWDGLKHLFDRRNFTFPTGLLDRVTEVFRREGVAHEIEDLREEEPPAAAAAALAAAAAEGPDYARECLEAALAARRALLELAPGAARWPILARLIEAVGVETVVFTPGGRSAAQAEAGLRAHLPKPPGLAGGGGAVRFGEPLVISAPAACQALGVRIARHNGDDACFRDSTALDEGESQALALRLREARMVIFDDVQIMPADLCYQIIMRCGAANWRFGVSALPYRADGHDLLLEAAFGPFRHRTGLDRLLALGEIVPGRVEILRPPKYPPCERDREPEEIFQRAILQNAARHDFVAGVIARLAAEGRRVLALAENAEHARALAERVPNAVRVEDAQAPGALDRARAAFAAKKPRPPVIAPRAAGEALEDPRVDALLLAAPDANETLDVMRILRILAPARGKKDALAVDFFDPPPYLKDRARRRIELFRAQKGLETHCAET